MVEGAIAMVIHVGEDGALEAPFFAEDLGEKRIGSGGLHVADAVIGGHDATGFTFLEDHLEGFEVDFAERLLGEEGGGAFTALLLIVDGEVLEVAIDAFVGGGANDVSGNASH